MSRDCEVNVRFFAPPPELRLYFTTFYLIEIVVHDGGKVTDYLHPEWANLRFHIGDLPEADNRAGATISGTCFPATGPSSRAVRFTIGSTRMWGAGLLPLGWAKLVQAPAVHLADALVDGNNHAAFAGFTGLADRICSDIGDVEEELGIITSHFIDRAMKPVHDEERIIAVHAALIDPETATVADLVEKSGVSQRTLERCCDRAFGFAPKLLLRRQRFMRSLAHFMLDPSLKWIGAIDSHYHDQSQFVRDFRQFMGMTPRQYAALDKPILSAVVQERARFAGSAAQALDSPHGLRSSRGLPR
ncbi:MAG: helix-turn-helix domain-containing protein [Novosphingobium sp.]